MKSILVLLTVLATARSKQLPTITDEPTTTEATLSEDDTTPWSGAVAPLDKLAVSCERDSMHITVTLAQTESLEPNSIFDGFNGIVYPAGLGSNSSCLREYEGARGDLQYSLPLMGCNTMASDNADGTVEYYNNIIVQPHPKIVTGQGRGYHVRCRYRRRDLMQYHILHHQKNDRQGKSLSDDNDLQDLEKEFVMLPSVTMQLYKGDPEDKNEVSEAKVGDTVTLVVSLEKQDGVGMLVRDCYVHDALGWAEHKLIDEDGCPLDSAVMGMFSYSSDGLRAQVSFSAHKFAWSPSVYYTCGVKLCKHQCNHRSCTDKGKRLRRDLDEGSPATVEVFTGFYVNEADSLESDEVTSEKVFAGLYVNEADLLESDEVTSEKKEDEICISQRNFAIGICIAGVILMICVIAAIACILARRRNPKTYSRTGSSLYSGPYTNTGYSHTS